MRERIATWLFWWFSDNVVAVREPDLVIGAYDPGGPYLQRWYLTPWRHLQSRLRERAKASGTMTARAVAFIVGLLPNVYLHCFLRDDDDRALHDHPSIGASYLLRRGYIEHTIRYGGVHQRTEYRPGSFRILGLHHAHRIELHKRMVATGQPISRDNQAFMPVAEPCWSLFAFGPTLRRWGFHHPTRGWIDWEDWVREFGG